MQSPIDDLLSEITRLSVAIAGLPEDDPERRHLELERQALRDEAEALAFTGRHPVSVEREIEAIESRLEEIRAERITQGYQERRGGKNIQDPSAYSANINKMLDEHHAYEVGKLTARLERLRTGTPNPDAR
ncbi:MAG: hypothetical protein BMS9Abin20_0959 [Acidimicrobiia bacterium]|nr:MAG: hypothetical protein BMS9Abin20_0959 [Acidimicrobiia bacterium]